MSQISKAFNFFTTIVKPIEITRIWCAREDQNPKISSHAICALNYRYHNIFSAIARNLSRCSQIQIDSQRVIRSHTRLTKRKNPQARIFTQEVGRKITLPISILLKKLIQVTPWLTRSRAQYSSLKTPGRDQMAKRYTDTEKWKKQWYLELGSKGRDLWTYLLDNCDHAGIWEINLPLLSFSIGESVTIKDLKNYFGDRLLDVGDNKIWIPSFIEFQYGCTAVELDPKNRVHLSVIKNLEKIKGLSRVLVGVSDTPKDKDKDKDKEKDKDNSDSKSESTHPVQSFHEALSSRHPDSGKFESWLEGVDLSTPSLRRNSSAVMKAFGDFQKFEKWWGEFIPALKKLNTPSDQKRYATGAILKESGLAEASA